MNPLAQQKLQIELDDALGPVMVGEPSLKSSDPLDATHYESAVATSDVMKNLPYLAACINEVYAYTLRPQLDFRVSFLLVDW